MNDVERSLEAARAGLALNPNDTELMAELGVRYVLRNEGDSGRTLLRQAFARNPGQRALARPLLLRAPRGRAGADPRRS